LEVPVNSQKIDVWYAITATQILEPIFLEQVVNFSVLFESIMESEKTYCYFIQDGATAHTANYSISVLNYP
jgi:hypothetical protein